MCAWSCRNATVIADRTLYNTTWHHGRPTIVISGILAHKPSAKHDAGRCWCRLHCLRYRPALVAVIEGRRATAEQTITGACYALCRRHSRSVPSMFLSTLSSPASAQSGSTQQRDRWEYAIYVRTSLRDTCHITCSSITIPPLLPLLLLPFAAAVLRIYAFSIYRSRCFTTF